MNRSQASLSIINSQSPRKPMSIESVMPSSHLIFCHPLLPPSVFPSIRVFSNESALRIRWPKYWSFQLKHQSFQWTPRTDLLQDGLVGSPCSPRDSQESSPTPQFKSIISSVLSFLYGPTLTPYMTTRKTIALTRRTLVGKVMSLLLNMLSRLVITFLPMWSRKEKYKVDRKNRAWLLIRVTETGCVMNLTHSSYSLNSF